MRLDRRRVGLGSMLLDCASQVHHYSQFGGGEELEAAGKALAERYVFAHVNRDNARALRFYR